MAVVSDVVDVCWQPLPSREINGRIYPSSQSLAVSAPFNEILYCGTRGPGKTDAQLMAFAKHVGEGYGTFWNGVILDTQYNALTEVFDRAKLWFRKVWGKSLKIKESKGDQEIEWPTGEKLIFRIAASEKDYWNVGHGQQFSFIGWNELTKQKDCKLYDMFLSANRTSWTREKDAPDTNLPPIPLVCFSTTNSYGIGFRWVKARFIVPAPYGVPVEVEREIFSAKSQKKVKVKRTQVAIFGSYKENPFLDDIYIAFLDSITNINMRKSWLEGSWDISGGGMFDDLWAAHIHVKPRFRIPKNWTVDRAFDWGSTEPFSIGWFAISNGEQAVLEDGRIFCPPKNSIVQCGEWYGATSIDDNEGLHLSVKAISDGLKNREINMMRGGWIPSQPWPGPADNQIRNVNEVETDTIEKKFLDEGIKWLPSDKAPGSRINGAQIFREMLENALKGEGPGFYMMDNCRAGIAIIPNLPRDADLLDDVDKNAIDHPWDMLRYRILRGVIRTARAFKLRLSF